MAKKHPVRRSRDAKVGGRKKVTAKERGTNKPARSKTRNVVSSHHPSAEKAFAKLRTADGCGAFLLVGEHVEGRWDAKQAVVELPSRGRKTVSGKYAASQLDKIVRGFAAMGHADRVKMMRKLLDGPATYRALQRTSGLKAGPLYHHINQLRLAGLILPKQRDLYELTRGGRNLVLVAIAAAGLINDTRRRPVALK